MFLTNLFLLRSNFSSKLLNDKNLIIAFVNKFINDNHITRGGTWKFTNEHGFEVGIGRYKGNKGLATGRLHLEIEENNLVCYDKRRKQGDHYTMINNPAVRSQIISKFAEEVRNPGSVDLSGLGELLDQQGSTQKKGIRRGS